MATQKYSVTPQTIETLLTWVKCGEIAIPEIQRPFVWEATKVRNLLDSLYQGYPVGYLIAWRNPSVQLKDGSSAAGKRILIDGQQRVTALMASILGYEVLTDDYETRRIQIAFNPQAEIFEVANPAIAGNPAWITDIAHVFDPATSIFQLVTNDCQANSGCTQDAIFKVIERLRGIIHNHVGIIDLSEELDIEIVTEILPPSSRAMTSIAMTQSDGYGEDEAAARRSGARGGELELVSRGNLPYRTGGCAAQCRFNCRRADHSAAESILRRINVV